ncbi:LPS export ABC transporter permease LptG [Oceanomicrobium pacificus]|uniref:LPS export ABC transporter permease LptG n=1 Tax=Oceanomicrobium pacificus TaxID=2692916 RepID=A0A6B0TWQ9_9RHOB|nr:LPS export ABC transporter permease LptG [Oceanomicrobium pacificus]MXU65712.1 LPS export ABC transporter permease LptG [Oceanomicrobium pacificus]
MTLAYYVAWRFLMGFLRVQLVVLALVVIFDGVENLRKMSRDGVAFIDIAAITLYRAPAIIEQAFPLTILISALVTFLGLSRSSELVVTRAAGVSSLRMVFVPCVIGACLGVFAILVLNPIVIATSQRAEILAAEEEGQVLTRLSLSNSGLWLRQGDASGQAVIQANRASPDGAELKRVRFFIFDEDGRIAERIEADSATLEPAQWHLRNARIWGFAADGTEDARESYAHEDYYVPTDLTSDLILDGFAAPSSLPLTALPGFILQLEESGFSATRHRLYFQNQLAQPLFFVAMVLIGAVFSLRHVRFGHMGIMVLSAVVSGFFLYFIAVFAQSLGSAGQVPVMIAAWVPSAAAVMLALGLLLHLEDG